jgi:carbamoyl-phosphate synthase large subunit
LPTDRAACHRERCRGAGVEAGRGVSLQRPRRPGALRSILIIGAGPIVIGQACEFDYSGAQACKALREEGYRVILVNSNPATIMTDPEMADATYIEPVTWQMVEKIIAVERPDALLPTMGGQTALNCALDLAREGVLEKYGVEMIGASRQAIDKAEDREKFKAAMAKIGLASPRSALAHSMEEALQVQAVVGFPTIMRPSFTLGGTGGGIAYNREEFVAIVERALDASPTKEVLIEESVIGWKEFEMEVVRDCKDNCIIICSIENLDPMGVHTGDSITVAPAQTLTDKEYQIMRDASIACLREIGVDTGGSNVQFAINPQDGRMVIIEMNPRVSRSSALASKATGFPIAKVAAKLAVGYTLDELRNEITGGATPASFEPAIDYVVTKVPRFAFEKFPQADDRLTTQMKSVGEVMAIGRTFQESMQKALRGLETGADGFDERTADADTIENELGDPGPERMWYVADAFRRRHDDGRGATNSRTSIPGSSRRSRTSCARKKALDGATLEAIDRSRRCGASSATASPTGGSQSCSRPNRSAVRARRHDAGHTPGLQARGYLCRGICHAHRLHVLDLRGRVRGATRRIAGRSSCWAGGPTASGRASSSTTAACTRRSRLREDGFETIMVNCNPETVSTDYDTSDRLYFEPLTLEDVLEIAHVEKPFGVIVQFGGQTPLKLARDLEANGVPIIGTTPDSIDIAEDRERFQKLLNRLKLKQPPNRTARSPQKALAVAEEIGYPLVVRPVLRAGRARDGNRLPAERSRALHARGGQGVQRQPGAARPFPQRRDRGRRRRRVRRRTGRDRRRDGAHRGGRGAFRRFGVFAAAVFTLAGHAGRN